MRSLTLALVLVAAAGCKHPQAKKPILYLYPQDVTEVSVRFADPDAVALTSSYPDYGADGWDVVGYPDGTLIDVDSGEEYYGLYWEGLVDPPSPPRKGFVVPAAETESFLDGALADLGLTRREAEEFVVYWAPILEEHPYNLVHFSTDAWNAQVPLDIAPAPDTLLRVMMDWRPCRGSLKIQPQVLTAPERRGFTVVEWGGTRLR